MSIENNKTIVNRFFRDGFSAGRIDILEGILAPDCSYNDAGRPKFSNRKDFIEYVREGRKPYSNIDVVVDDVVTENNRVAVRCTYHLEKENDQFRLPVMGFFHLDRGKIVNIWRNIVISDD